MKMRCSVISVTKNQHITQGKKLCSIICKQSPQQKVGYRPQINHPQLPVSPQKTVPLWRVRVFRFWRPLSNWSIQEVPIKKDWWERSIAVLIIQLSTSVNCIWPQVDGQHWHLCHNICIVNWVKILGSIWVHLSAQSTICHDVCTFFPPMWLIETRDKTLQDKLVSDSCICIRIFFAAIYNNWVYNCIIAWLPLWKGSDPFPSMLALYTLFRYMLFSYRHYLPFFFSLIFWIILVGPASLNVFKSCFLLCLPVCHCTCRAFVPKNINLVFPSAFLFAGFMTLNF